MTCEEARALVLESRSTEALAGHLRGCPECAATAADHARASALGADVGVGETLRPLELAEIRGRVVRRRAVRLGLGSAAALLVLSVAVRRPSAPASAAPSAAPLDVGQLLTEVDGFTHVDVAVADPAYAPFGPMASWFALPDLDKCSTAQPLSVGCFSSSSEDLPE